MKAVLSQHWQTNLINKGSENSSKKKLNTEEEKSVSVICCVTKYDVNIRWVICTECRSWVHCLCESIPPNTHFGDDAVYECLSCKSFTLVTLEGCFVVKVQENRDRQSELETHILAKGSDINSDIC